eukprot:g1413.t1
MVSSPFCNTLWLVTGGIFVALVYFVAALVFIPLIGFGITTAWQLMSLAKYSLWPFGSPWKDLINQNLVRGQGDSTCAYSMRVILWLPFLLIQCAIHVLCGVVLFVSIAFIPIARVHLTLLRFSFFPFYDTPASRESLLLCCMV